MALVETIHISHIPPTISVFVSLFKDLKNASFLRQQLLDCNTDFEYAFLDASTIISTTHVLAAVFRAINDLLASRLRSRNVHSEIVFSLSPNNNIATSFQRFGISPTTTSLLAIKVSHPSSPTTADAVRHHLSTYVDGTAVEFSDHSLEEMTDMAAVRKIYKMNNSSGSSTTGEAGGKKGKRQEVNGKGAVGGNDAGSEYVQRKEVEIAALGLMALKGS